MVLAVITRKIKQLNSISTQYTYDKTEIKYKAFGRNRDPLDMGMVAFYLNFGVGDK